MGFRVNKDEGLNCLLDKHYGNLDSLKTPVPIRDDLDAPLLRGFRQINLDGEEFIEI